MPWKILTLSRSLTSPEPGASFDGADRTCSIKTYLAALCQRQEMIFVFQKNEDPSLLLPRGARFAGDLFPRWVTSGDVVPLKVLTFAFVSLFLPNFVSYSNVSIIFPFRGNF